MCGPVAIAVAGTVLSGVGTAVQTVGALRQAKAQKRIAEERNRREKVQQFRQARIKRARLAQAAENQGVGGSSADIGGQSSVTSQLSGNLSFLSTIGQLQRRSAKAQQLSTIGEAVGGIGGLVSANATPISKALKGSGPGIERRLPTQFDFVGEA